MNLIKKRWLILIASCLVTLCIGSLYAWSVFAVPMASHLTEITGQKITNLSMVFTVANSVGPVTMIFGGVINDKLGPKWVLLSGGFLFGGGMIGSGFASSVPILMITYGLGVGLGMGMVYGPIISNAVKFFPDKSGFAGGLTTACYGASSILIPPVATLIAENYGVTAAFKGIGLVMMVIICTSALIIEACPSNFQIPSKPKVLNADKQGESGGTESTYKEMLQQPKFYLMLIILTCGAFAGMMIISQAASIAQKMMGLSAASAATFVSVIALFNTIGRLTSGALSDKLGAVGTLRITFLCSLAVSIMLYFCNSSNIIPAYIGVSIIGFCFGSIMGIYPGFTAKEFGRKNNSVNYGIMFIGFALAGLVGPVIMNQIYTLTGKYQPAFCVAAVLAVTGEVLIYCYTKISMKKVPK